MRDAVSQPNRIVVFDVSGVIKLSSRIVFSNNLYVAGQTAPGEGVTIYGDGVSFSGASNIICRYLRVRMGHNGSNGKDCAGVANGTNMIFDHCSFSWGLDETFSINGFGAAWNITLQNCIFGQGLMTHSAGGLMQADSITLYRNLYIDNSTRNNKVKGTNQYANNVVYNWSNGCYIMGGDSEGSSYVNIESNLFINGPSGGGNCFGGANQDFHCYGVDNWQDANRDGLLNPTEVTNYSASDHGIVASRLTEHYYRPAIVLTSALGFASGSARSIQGFDVYSAINSCRDIIENFGGHTYAAGLTLKEEKIPELTERIERWVEEHITDVQQRQHLDIDMEVKFNDVTPRLYKSLRVLSP